MFFAAQTHHAQCGCDGSFYRREHCANEKYSSVFPNALREQPRKGSQDRDIVCWQGWYVLPLGRVFALGYPAFLLISKWIKSSLAVKFFRSLMI